MTPGRSDAADTKIGPLVSQEHREKVLSYWINSLFLRDLRTAFGGSKQSGIGREGGVNSLEFNIELRNVMLKY